MTIEFKEFKEVVLALVASSVSNVVTETFVSKAAWVALEMGKSKSLVLFTFPNPTASAVTPVTNP